MAVQKQTYTSGEFLDFINQPENLDRLFELIDGEIIVVSPSYGYVSAIAMQIVFFIKLYLRNNPIGYVTGEQGGYDISDDNIFAPDVGFVSKARLAQLPRDGFIPIPPDLAVEIVSPSDLRNRRERIDSKIERYLEAGVLTWYVYPDRQEVDVYVPGQPIRTLGMEDTLDGGDVLPGFTLPVRDVFDI